MGRRLASLQKCREVLPSRALRVLLAGACGGREKRLEGGRGRCGEGLYVVGGPAVFAADSLLLDARSSGSECDQISGKSQRNRSEQCQRPAFPRHELLGRE